MDESQVSNYLAVNRDYLRKWLLENADEQWLRDLLENLRRRRRDSGEKASRSSDCEGDGDGDGDTLAALPPISSARSPTLILLQREAATAAASSGAGGASDEDDPISEKEDHLLSSVIPRMARKSVTSDLFHQWLESGPRTSQSTTPIGTGPKLESPLSTLGARLTAEETSSGIITSYCDLKLK